MVTDDIRGGTDWDKADGNPGEDGELMGPYNTESPGDQVGPS